MLIDETGLFLNPTVRRSWSLVGRTPVIGGDGGHRTKVSVIGAVTVSPRAHRLGFYFATAVDGYFSAEKVVAFLRDLLAHLPGKVVVIWDGGGNHKGPVLRAFLKRNKRLWLARLPAYAPDLNPVEAVWSWLKWGPVGQLRARRPDRTGRLGGRVLGPVEVRSEVVEGIVGPVRPTVPNTEHQTTRTTCDSVEHTVTLTTPTA